jgi:hypothetical protein
MLKAEEWEMLIEDIRDAQCTPFLGAGAGYGVLPLGGGLAQRLADEFKYPMEDSNDLARVTQFIALTYGDGTFPKRRVKAIIEACGTPNFGASDEPHSILAAFRLPLYITTNYDDFMVRALTERRKEPAQEVCRWNSQLKKDPSPLYKSRGFSNTVARPLVFHLHGHVGEVSSMVLTEDDYVDFLVNVASDPGIIPRRIEKALTETSLLFIGYRLADLNFRVVLRSLSRFLGSGQRRRNFAVMLPPAGEGKKGKGQDAAARRSQEGYLTRYYDQLNVAVYWGTAQAFFQELYQRAGHRLPSVNALF